MFEVTQAAGVAGESAGTTSPAPGERAATETLQAPKTSVMAATHAPRTPAMAAFQTPKTPAMTMFQQQSAATAGSASPWSALVGPQGKRLLEELYDETTEVKM